MSTTWIVVADRSRCSVYRRDKGLALDPVEQLMHPRGRMANTDLDTDGQGRGGDSTHGGHAYSTHQTTHDHDATVFAKEIARHLASARAANRFDALVLVAEPHFLGLIHEELDAPTRALVRNQIHKHLTEMPLAELAKQVPALLS